MDRVVTVISALGRSQLLQPPLNINDRASMRKMVTKLLYYLKADTVAYHARAVHLICSLETSTTEKHVESVIAQTMASPQSRNVAEAYEAFGVLWRLSGRFLSIDFYGLCQTCSLLVRGQYGSWTTVPGANDDCSGDSQEQ